MRDNHKDPWELTIVGIDVPREEVAGIGYDAESNALPDDHPVIQGMAAAMLTEIGTFGAVTYARVGNLCPVLIGRKRVRALRIANAQREAAGLPALKIATDYRALSGDDQKRALHALLLQKAENYHRYINKSPLAPVRAAQELLNAGSSVDEIALCLGGVSKNGVRRWLKIGELEPAVQAAIEENKITADAGLLLHGKSREAQLSGLATLLAPESAAGADAPVEPADAQRKPVVAKRRQRTKADGEAPKRVGKKTAEEKLASGNGAPQKRTARVVLKTMAWPGFTASEEFRRGARWAIGDLSDDEAGVYAKEPA